MYKLLLKRNALNLLVAWFGIFQVTHLLIHLLGLSELSSERTSLFIYSNLKRLLNNDLAFILTILDIIYGILSVVFVLGYFNQKKWSQALGLVTLVLSANSFALFDYIMIAGESWKSHLFEFLYVNIGFFPILFLLGLFYYFSVRTIPLFHESHS